jgi:hypothetical protein
MEPIKLQEIKQLLIHQYLTYYFLYVANTLDCVKDLVIQPI